MKLFFLSLCLSFMPLQGFSLDKLHSDYLIRYGDPDSSIQMVHYFSFTCPHCLSLFRKDFQDLKEKYIDVSSIACVFHPIPMDLLTVQAMDCLEKLSEREKRIFLSAILEVIPLDDPQTATLFMQKAMEVFDKPEPNLQDKEYLAKTRAFKDAFLFLKQEDKIEAVPSVEINGRLFRTDVPTFEFIESQLRPLLQMQAEEEKST